MTKDEYLDFEKPVNVRFWRGHVVSCEKTYCRKETEEAIKDILDTVDEKKVRSFYITVNAAADTITTITYRIEEMILPGNGIAKEEKEEAELGLAEEVLRE